MLLESQQRFRMVESFRFRIQHMFNIIIEYPESIPVLEDLKASRLSMHEKNRREMYSYICDRHASRRLI
jgi:hypothetical protein